MNFIERLKGNREEFRYEPTGDARRFIFDIQQSFPNRSKAVDRLAKMLEEQPNISLIYKHIPTFSSLFEFIKDKRAFLDADGEFKISEEETPDFLRSYLSRTHYRTLMLADVKATVDQAFFILIHPPKKGKSWVSVAHHNFTTYRGDMYGPGWAEPRYGIFSENPRGFDIAFRVVSHYDPKEIIGKYCSDSGRSSITEQMFIGPEQKSFSIDNQQGDLFTAYVPIRVTNWSGYDIRDGIWKKGWEMFGITGGVLVKEIEAFH